MKVKGNYYIWSAVQIAMGVSIWGLHKFTGWDYPFVLFAVFIPGIAYKIWFSRTHRADEREISILEKVQATAGIVTVTILSGAFEKHQQGFIPFIWTVFFSSRGLMGFFYFLRG